MVVYAVYAQEGGKEAGPVVSRVGPLLVIRSVPRLGDEALVLQGVGAQFALQPEPILEVHQLLKIAAHLREQVRGQRRIDFNFVPHRRRRRQNHVVALDLSAVAGRHQHLARVGPADLHHRQTEHDFLHSHGLGEEGRELLIPALATVDFALSPVAFKPAGRDHRQLAQIAHALQALTVVAFQQHRDRRAGGVADILLKIEPAPGAARVVFLGAGVRVRLVAVEPQRVGVHPLTHLVHLFP